MSTAGYKRVQQEVRRTIKDAAHQAEIINDEPLMLLLGLMAQMVSEVSDETSRKAWVGVVANIFPIMVDMYLLGHAPKEDVLH